MKTPGEVTMLLEDYNEFYLAFIYFEKALTVKFKTSEWNGRVTNYIEAEIDFTKVKDLLIEKLDKLEKTEQIMQLKNEIHWDNYKVASVMLSSETHSIPIEDEHSNA